MTDIVERLRLLESGARWVCNETADTLENAADEIERLRAAVAAARREGIEAAAEIAQGTVYCVRYRTWPWWINRDGSEGNRSSDSDIVQHADKIAAAIRALLEGK